MRTAIAHKRFQFWPAASSSGCLRSRSTSSAKTRRSRWPSGRRVVGSCPVVGQAADGLLGGEPLEAGYRLDALLR
jgi:hypothetical protein